MNTSFDVAISVVHSIQVSVPGIGDVNFPAGGTLQLLNVSRATIEYFRGLSDMGFKTDIGKKVPNAFMTYDYNEGGSSKDSFDEKVEEEREKAKVRGMSALEKVSNYVIPSGAHQGKKICELPVATLKRIMKSTTNETTKSAINTYLNLTNQND